MESNMTESPEAKSEYGLFDPNRRVIVDGHTRPCEEASSITNVRHEK